MTEATLQERVYRAAVAYIERGWMVFPLHSVVRQEDGTMLCTCGSKTCTDAGKHPLEASTGLKSASKDRAKIDEWFGDRDGPPRNIGIRTGMVSGITVIDVDTGPGKAGAESWAEITREHGETPTLTSVTGSGGMHLVFAYNSALKTAANVLGPGIDVRNDGGYIVAAPSLHRSGKHYAWIDWREAPAMLPPHLSKPKSKRGRRKKDEHYKSKYSIEQVRRMLTYVDAGDRDLWRSVGIILGREFSVSDEAWQAYFEWSETWGGRKGRNHDEIMREAFYDLSQQESESKLSIGTLVRAAMEGGWAPEAGEVPIGHFVYYGPGNNYIYRPTMSHWSAQAVDAACSPVNVDGALVAASKHLQSTQLVTSLTTDPQLEEDYIRGKDARDGELIEVPGAAVFNLYRKPTIELGDARLAGPYLDHVHRVFNKAEPNLKSDADQFLDYMAHRVQRPWEKPRFGLLLAGEMGTGKDTCIDMAAPALGHWNLANISPEAFESNFNEFYAATLVRISETSNLHEMSKWAFNERTKVLIAGNPDYQTINPKYGEKYTVRMYCGVILTTNHLASGIYIPPGDRRYDVIESATLAEMGLADEVVKSQYFEELWAWFNEGGAAHVAAYLHERDVSQFKAGTGQRKTAAHASVVAAGMVGDAWLQDVLDQLGTPTVVRADWILELATQDGAMKTAEARGKLSMAIGRAGYMLHRNPQIADGRWKFNKKQVIVYKKADADPEAVAAAWGSLTQERF